LDEPGKKDKRWLQLCRTVWRPLIDRCKKKGAADGKATGGVGREWQLADCAG